MEELLFGSAIALLIALLAWSDQIRGLHKETLEAESTLLTVRGINWKIIKRLLRKKEEPDVILAELNNMLNKGSSQNLNDLQIILNFRKLDHRLQYLELLNDLKYYLVIVLTALFFISGIILPNIKECSSFFIFKWKIFYSSLPLIVCMIFCGALLAFLVYLSIIERKYRIEFVSVMEEI